MRRKLLIIIMLNRDLPEVRKELITLMFLNYKNQIEQIHRF